MFDVDFLNTDTKQITAELLEDFEKYTGETLTEGDQRKIFLQGFAYVISGLINDFNIASRNNLIRYATGEYLDAIGEMFGVKRDVYPNKATTILKYTLSAITSNPVIIPKGSRATADGKLFFETDTDLIIPSGNIEGIVSATASQTGEKANGLAIGQVNKIVDGVANVFGVTNLKETAGGTEREEDESLRQRIKLAPFTFSTAGSEQAYKQIALTASEEIGDIQVYSPTPGTVKIVIVKKGGKIPSSSDNVISLVQKACNEKTVRPLTDKVEVCPAVSVSSEINVDYWIDENDKNIATSIKDQVYIAVEKYILWQTQKIGRNINADKLKKYILDAGAYKVNIISPTDTIVNDGQVVQFSSKTITYKGLIE